MTPPSDSGCARSRRYLTRLRLHTDWYPYIGGDRPEL